MNTKLLKAIVKMARQLKNVPAVDFPCEENYIQFENKRYTLSMTKEDMAEFGSTALFDVLEAIL